MVKLGVLILTFYACAVVFFGGVLLPVAYWVYHLYIVKAESVEQAAKVMDGMKDAGIGTALYYPLALHEQEVFEKVDGWVKPDLPVVVSCDNRTFALPCFPGITREQQEDVVRVVKAALA